MVRERNVEIIIAACNQCGKCCYGKEILITPEEAEIISNVVNKSVQEFAIPKEKVFMLKTVNNHCIFLENKRCVIHAVKPFQCKTYPIIYHYLALTSSVFEGVQGDNLVFSCKNGHTKIIRFTDFLQQTEERLAYLRSVYGEENGCKDDSYR